MGTSDLERAFMVVSLPGTHTDQADEKYSNIVWKNEEYHFWDDFYSYLIEAGVTRKSIIIIIILHTYNTTQNSYTTLHYRVFFLSGICQGQLPPLQRECDVNAAINTITSPN